MIRNLSAIALVSLAAAFAAPAMAGTCAATVDSDDAMQFTTKERGRSSIVQEFQADPATRRHAAQGGDNFVLGKTAGVASINADGMKAGAAAGYFKAGDARIVAASKLTGGGEPATVNLRWPGSRRARPIPSSAGSRGTRR